VAGMPVRSDLEDTIELMGGDQWVFERLAGGATVTQLAKALGVSRGVLSWWCNSDCRKDAYLRARKSGAAALAEDSLAIADNAKPIDVQVARLRVEHRRWMASKLDPDRWETQKGPAIQVNVANLHIDALRKPSANPVIEHDNSDLPDYLT
jgi:hypothetical protein